MTPSEAPAVDLPKKPHPDSASTPEPELVPAPDIIDDEPKPHEVLDDDLLDDLPDDLPEDAPRPRESGRSTAILVAAIIVLALILAGEAYYLYGPPSDDRVVSASRPVVASDLEISTAVETAGESVEKIVTRSFETYDEQVEAATATMTDTFAEEYRTTTEEIKDPFVEAKTEVTVTVVAQSVMTASPQQAQVLLFLNQFVTKDGGEALYSPYRALATVVKTEQGWLVSKLETK